MAGLLCSKITSSHAAAVNQQTTCKPSESADQLVETPVWEIVMTNRRQWAQGKHKATQPESGTEPECKVKGANMAGDESSNGSFSMTISDITATESESAARSQSVSQKPLRVILRITGREPEDNKQIIKLHFGICVRKYITSISKPLYIYKYMYTVPHTIYTNH